MHPSVMCEMRTHGCMGWRQPPAAHRSEACKRAGELLEHARTCECPCAVLNAQFWWGHCRCSGAAREQGAGVQCVMRGAAGGLHGSVFVPSRRHHELLGHPGAPPRRAPGAGVAAQSKCAPAFSGAGVRRGPTPSKLCRGGSWHPCSASTPSHPDQSMACASTRGPSSVPCSMAPEQWHCSAVAPARPRRSQPCQQSRAASAWRIILEGAERADAPRAAGGADGAGGDRGRGGRLLRARLPHAAGLHQVRALAARRRGCGARACGGLAHGSDPDHNPKSGASPGTLQQRHADLGPGRASFGPWRGAGLTAGARGAQAARLPDRLQLHLHVCRLLRAGHRLHVVRAPSRSPRARGQQPPGLHARCAALDPLPRGPPPAGMH